MKAIRLFGIVLLTVLMSVSFSACSSSDDETQPSSNPLIGTWESIDPDGDNYILELKADGSYYQAEFEGKTENIKSSYKGTYNILSISGNTYEVSIFTKERQKRNGEIVTINETQTGFLTLSDNNNTMVASGSSEMTWKRKR